MMVRLTIPGEPQGKGRHRAVRRGDHIATYTPRKTKDYEDEVQFCYRQAYGDRMAFAVDEPISATNGLAYPDDKQVVDLQVFKTYDLEGYVEVELRNWRTRTDG